jgi:hypothetical protein
MNWKASLALIVVSQTIVATAYAGDASTVSTTRELAKQGLAAYDAGHFEEAAQKLTKAYAVIHLPTLAVASARALAKTGKLLAASELYLEATRIPRDKSWAVAQDEAQRDAYKEQSELLTRIAHVTVIISGADPSGTSLKIDGTTIPQALADAEQMVDPGERQIEARFGNKVMRRSIQLKEGEHVRITLAFDSLGNANALSPATDQPQTANQSPLTTSSRGEPAASRGSVQRAVGWITVGVGGAGLVLGSVTGMLALSKRSSLQDSTDCSPVDRNSCTVSRASDVDTYNGMRTISSVGFIAGGVLTAAGVTLLLTAPKRDMKPTAQLWLTPSSVGIYGGF